MTKEILIGTNRPLGLMLENNNDDDIGLKPPYTYHEPKSDRWWCSSNELPFKTGKTIMNYKLLLYNEVLKGITKSKEIHLNSAYFTLGMLKSPVTKFTE